MLESCQQVKERNVLKSLINSGWGIALTSVIHAITAIKNKKELKLTIIALNRFTNTKTAFELALDDIPNEIDLIGPKLLPIIIGYKFCGLKLETSDDVILSIEINL